MTDTKKPAPTYYYVEMTENEKRALKDAALDVLEAEGMEMKALEGHALASLVLFILGR